MDGRYNSAESFDYRLEAQFGTTTERIEEFNLMRQWFHDTFGAAMERDLNRWMTVDKKKKWAWHVDLNKSHFFLYIKSDPELALWTLKWT